MLDEVRAIQQPPTSNLEPLETYPEREGIQLRSLIIHKHVVDIVIEEEIYVIESNLKSYAIAQVGEVVIIVVNFFLFIAILRVHLFGITVEEVACIGPHSNSKT